MSVVQDVAEMLGEWFGLDDEEARECASQMAEAGYLSDEAP